MKNFNIKDGRQKTRYYNLYSEAFTEKGFVQKAFIKCIWRDFSKTKWGQILKKFFPSLKILHLKYAHQLHAQNLNANT